MVTIGFLHTADVHVATFRGLVAELDPAARDVHVVDPALLAEATAPGTPARIAARLAELTAAGADIVVCTCSTIGPMAEGPSVLRVDRPMAEAAAGRRIAVIYAVESTLEPTLALLEEAGASDTVRAVPCLDAWRAFEKGDLDAYAQMVATAARQAAADADVVLLAQASMAPAAELLTDLPIPVLTSPRTAVQRALNSARDKGARIGDMEQKPSVSCVFVCHDGGGRVLLARRSAGARDEPGAWDCGAGALEFGEGFEEAVTREVIEEYVAKPLAIQQLGVRNVVRDDPPSHWVAVVFAVRLDPAAVRIGEPHKFDELGWFAPGELPAPLHSQLPATLALFRP